MIRDTMEATCVNAGQGSEAMQSANAEAGDEATQERETRDRQQPHVRHGS
jgi:hypothetical protein